MMRSNHSPKVIKPASGNADGLFDLSKSKVFLSLSDEAGNKEGGGRNT